MSFLLLGFACYKKIPYLQKGLLLISYFWGSERCEFKKVTLDVTRVVNAIDKTKKHQFKKTNEYYFFVLKIRQKMSYWVGKS